MPLVSFKVQAWWIDLTRKKSKIEERNARWLEQCRALATECAALIAEGDTLFKAIVNPKLEKKAWRVHKFSGKKEQLDNRLRMCEQTKGADKQTLKYAVLHVLREDYRSLKQKLAEALEECRTLQDDKYVFREFTVPLLTPARVAALNKKVEGTGFVFSTSEVTVFIALRASSSSELDITQEWDGIDAFIAAGKVDLSDATQDLDQWAQLLADQRDDGASEGTLRNAVTVLVRSRTSTQEAAAEDARRILSEIAGTTYLIKQRAKVYRQVKIRKIAYAASSTTMAVGRLVATSGADPTAYYSIIKSIISVSSLLLREALNDVGDACAQIQRDLQEMDGIVKKALVDPSESWWKDQGIAILNRSIQAAIGVSYPTLSGALGTYRDHQLFFSRKLADARKALAQESLNVQQLLADIDSAILLWESEKAAAAKKGDDAQVAYLEAAGAGLQTHREKIAEQWAQVAQSIHTVDAAYVGTFSEMEEALEEYRQLIDTYLNPILTGRGFTEADGASAAYRAILAYNTGAAIAKTDNLFKLSREGLTTLGGLIASAV